MDNARKLDFNLTIKSKGFNRLVKDIFDSMQNTPSQSSYRDKLRQCLRIVLLNLRDTNTFDGGWISYRRVPDSLEYKQASYSAYNMIKVVDFLEAKNLIRHWIGFYNREAPEKSRISRMQATLKLLNLFDRYQVDQAEISQEVRNELIELRDANKKKMPLPQTQYVMSMTANIQMFNVTMFPHDIATGSGCNLHKKQMHRVFNLDLDHGGRFYGPDWQRLNGEARSLIKINNNPVVELDYSNFHPTILYAQKGLQPDGDAYELAGYSKSQAMRKFLKAVMLIRLNTKTNEATRRAVQHAINKKELELPDEVHSINDLVHAFTEKHHAIVDLFNKDTGKRLQRLDSELTELIHIEFANQDIPLLSVHDSYVIEKWNQKKLYRVMNEAFEKLFKQPCKVSKK